MEDEAQGAQGWDLESWCRAGLSLAVTAAAFGCALLLLPALLLMYSGTHRDQESRAWQSQSRQSRPPLTYL